MFWLSFRTAFLTVATLGLYRFWMKTRLRRWYWSAVRIGGHPLEYSGDPIEKLLGFLLAVVILAFYIGLVNLVLMFLSFVVFQGPGAAYGLSLLGVLPLFFYAQYRARRYVLARTRFRGVRFGLEAGAWGYAGRALLYWGLTILTLGALLPRMTFLLEKFRSDRTFYGTKRLEQGGRWQMLYAAMLPLVAAGLLTGAAVLAGYLGRPSPAAGFGVMAAMTALYGVVHYRVVSLRRLTETKRMDGVTLRFAPSPARVAVLMTFGYLGAFLTILVLLMAVGFALAAVLGLAIGNFHVSTADLPTLSGPVRWLATAGALGLYFSVFLLWTTLTHVFVTMPVHRHYARRLVVVGAGALAEVAQRPRDEAPEAEGFAEALDVGASI